MANVDDIVRGLTKAQRAFISNQNLFRERNFYGIAWCIARELEGAGMLERPPANSPSTARKPSPLGLEVRDRLLSSGGEEL